MAYEIQIKIPFRAGHRLISPYVGKCNNIHGEGFTTICVFKRPNLDQCGMVFDFGSIKRKIKEWIDIHLDHAYIHCTRDEMGGILSEYGMKTYDIG